MGPVGDQAVALRELLVLDAVLEEVGVGRVDVAVVRVRLQRTLCVLLNWQVLHDSSVCAM